MGDPNKMKSGASRSGQGATGAVPGTQGSGSADKSASQKSNMDFILDIPLEISVELGRTTLMINDLLEAGSGIGC